MQILSNTNNNQQKPNFQGLNRYLSRHFPQEGIGVISKQTVSSSEFVTEAIKKYPKSRRFVGNLPHDWIEKLPIENRKEHVQKIQDLFASLARILYCQVNEHEINLAINYDKLMKFESKFKKLLGIDAEITLLNDGTLENGRGSFAKAYKLKANNKNYVFKVYHSGKDFREFIDSSWKVIETARAPFVMRTSKKCFAKFNFGKIATPSSKDGFMLTEFLEEKPMNQRQECAALFRLLTSPIASADLADSIGFRNLINLKIFDFGELIMHPAKILKQINEQKNKIDIKELRRNFLRNSDKINIQSKATKKDDYEKSWLRLSFMFENMYKRLQKRNPE